VEEIRREIGWHTIQSRRGKRGENKNKIKMEASKNT
jgi:hypothetical protein